MLVWWLLAGVGTLIIAGLAYYAGSLLFQLKHKRAEIAELEKKAEENIRARNVRLHESIQFIAKAVVEEQCELSEGAIRICVLLDNLQLDNKPDYVSDFPGMHQLYSKIQHMPTHEARKKYSKKEIRQMDVERWKAEAEFKQAVLEDASKLAELELPRSM